MSSSSPVTTLHSLYKKMISSTKEKGNIIYYDGVESFELSYAELDRNVNKIADMLMSFHVSNEVIGCCCGPGLPLPAILLGVLQASSSFAVIDRYDAQKYLENIAQFVPMKIFLVEDTFLQASKLKIDESWMLLEKMVIAGCSVTIFKHHLNEHKSESLISGIAYIIQTSGTTGSSKVVQVPHQCITPNITHFQSIYNVSPDDVILLVSPLTFDPSIIDIFLAMSTGATLIIIPDHMKCMTQILQEIILLFKITILQITPSLMQTFKTDFLSQKLLGKESKLRILALGGERCPSLKKLILIKSPENCTRIFNLYGLTEMSCWAMYKEIKFQNVQDKPEIALGIPLSDTDIAVFDECGTKIEEGYGQLFLGSLKRWCVVNDESSENLTGTMWPTGDWVHVTKDGEVFFEGRKDSMMKYHGKKFLMSSIDKIFEKIPEVSHHLAIFCENKDEIYIFVVINSAFVQSENVNEDFLHQKIRTSQKNFPVYKIIFIPEIPITSHGKADNLKLLQFAEFHLKKRKREKYVSVEALETMIKTLWKEYTNKNDVCSSDNFILCGGNSIFAVQFASEVQRKTSLLCSMLVDALLNSTYDKVLKLLRNELQKYNGSDDEPITAHKSKNQAKECDIIMPSHLSTNSIGNFDSKCNLQICYRRNRRGQSYLHLCMDCLYCHSLSFLNSKIETFGIEISWKFDMKKCIDSSPCLVQFFHSDRLVCYIGSHSGMFLAMDIRHGTVIWEKQLPDRIESSACLSDCGQFILVGCYDYKLYCFHILDGNIHWTLSTQAEIKSSVIVSPKNIAFVGSHDRCLYAVDIQVGKKLWSKKVGEGSIFSSPAFFSNFVCAATLDGIIIALDEKSGLTLWSYSYGKPFFSSPLVFSNSIFIGCVDGFLLHFDLGGNLVSKYHTDGPVFSSATLLNATFDRRCHIAKHKNAIVFGSHDRHIYCYSNEGDELWSYQCNSPVYAIPTSFVRGDGHQYVVGASVKGSIVILDAGTGKEICLFQCPGEIFSTPEVLDDYLVVGCRDNYAYVFKMIHLT